MAARSNRTLVRSAYGSILVCMESPGLTRQTVLRRATEIARRTGARLTLFHSAFSPLSAGPAYEGSRAGSEVNLRLRGLREQLEVHAAKLRAQGIRASTQVAWDYPPHEAIVRAVLQGKPDLVMAGSQRHRIVARLFLGNTDWQLIRLCPAPLLFVKGKVSYRRPRVLAAIDPGHPRRGAVQLDSRIMQEATTLAGVLQGRIEVLHVHVPLYLRIPASAIDGFTIPVDANLEQQLERTARRAVARTCRPFDLPEGQLHTELGLPEKVILAATRRLRTDILVMGAVSRSALGRLVIGSTAERILDPLGTDLLIVKPRGFRTSVSRRLPRAEIPFPAG